jgi:hypothetical protein
VPGNACSSGKHLHVAVANVRLVAHGCCTARVCVLKKETSGAKEAALGNQKDHKHTNIEVTSTCLSCGEQIGQGRFDTRQLAKKDVDKESATALPERDAMSLVNANLAVPINIAAALNVLSDGSIAAAVAQQTTPIDQSTGITPPTT